MSKTSARQTYFILFIYFQALDQSGTDKFLVVFPSGTPLPARRQHTLEAPGEISSVCLELYESLEKGPVKEDDRFAQVEKEKRVHFYSAILYLLRRKCLFSVTLPSTLQAMNIFFFDRVCQKWASFMFGYLFIYLFFARNLRAMEQNLA